MNASTANVTFCAANDDGKENNIMPGPQQATVFMRQSLEELNSALTCHLCHQMLNDPSTLACAHTFCWKVSTILLLLLKECCVCVCVSLYSLVDSFNILSLTFLGMIFFFLRLP